MNQMKMDNNNEIIKRNIKKTKRKMTMKIIRICLLCIAAVLLIVNIPNVLYTMQINRIGEAQKQAMLVYQFTTPDNIAGYSVETEGISVKKQVSLYYNNFVGRNIFDGHDGEIAIDYNLFTGKLDMYYPICGTYMHSSRYENLSEEYKQKIDAGNDIAIKALEKNKDNTVALVNVSLSESYSIDEILALTEEYDIEINWFAIESGYEGNEPPKHIGMPMQQYYTLGFPSKIYTPDTIFNPAVLDKDNIEEHIDVFLSNLSWVHENKNLVSNDIWMIEDDICNNLSADNIKCYGIQINGPTSEIYELIKTLDITYINIEDIEFWYW